VRIRDAGVGACPRAVAFHLKHHEIITRPQRLAGARAVTITYNVAFRAAAMNDMYGIANGRIAEN
jgi:hypothetical protein